MGRGALGGRTGGFLVAASGSAVNFQVSCSFIPYLRMSIQMRPRMIFRLPSSISSAPMFTYQWVGSRFEFEHEQAKGRSRGGCKGFPRRSAINILTPRSFFYQLDPVNFEEVQHAVEVLHPLQLHLAPGVELAHRLLCQDLHEGAKVHAVIEAFHQIIDLHL